MLVWNEFSIEWTDGVTGEKSWTHFGTDRRKAEQWLKSFEWTRFGDSGRVVTRTMSQGDWEPLGE